MKPRYPDITMPNSQTQRLIGANLNNKDGEERWEEGEEKNLKA